MTEAVQSFVIAIDGPSGTGKSTVARRVALALKAGYLDTGAMYRIATLAVLRAGIDPTDDRAVAEVVATLQLQSPTDPRRQQHALDGDDVTAEIRSDEVTLAVTPVSANAAVRTYLKAEQQRLANAGRMVVEGRDIGTVIVPTAPLKVYLTADPAERARRRQGQNRSLAGASGGADTDLATVAADLDRRDRHDSTRAVAPLQAADDAVVVDSSGMRLEDTVDQVLELAAQRGIS